MSGSLTMDEVRKTIKEIECDGNEAPLGEHIPQGRVTGTGGNSHKQTKAPEKGF